MSVEQEEEKKGTGWDFIDQFNTGGKYHHIWEAIEGVGRGTRDAYFDSLEKNTTEEERRKQEEYKKIQNAPTTEVKETNISNNTLLWVGGGLVAVLLLGGI